MPDVHSLIGIAHAYSGRCQESQCLTIIWRVECDGVVLEDEDEDKMLRLTSAMASSNSSRKFTYVTRIWYFDDGEGSQGGLVQEALLATYWLS